MKFLIAVVIIVGLSLGVWQLNNYWGTFKHKERPSGWRTPPPVPDDQLTGMPETLQPSLNFARDRGAAGLREFLTAYGNAINDPRRAAIELDYTVLVALNNPSEARRQFAKVKGRLQSDSPVYGRMKALEITYDDQASQ
jgi:hypothetical protein